MKLTIDDVRSRFIEHFDGTTGSVYASPGRINLRSEERRVGKECRWNKKRTCLLYRFERLRRVFFRR